MGRIARYQVHRVIIVEMRKTKDLDIQGTRTFGAGFVDHGCNRRWVS